MPDHRRSELVPVIVRYPEGARISGWPGTWERRISAARARLTTLSGGRVLEVFL